MTLLLVCLMLLQIVNASSLFNSLQFSNSQQQQPQLQEHFFDRRATFQNINPSQHQQQIALA